MDKITALQREREQINIQLAGIRADQTPHRNAISERREMETEA